MPPGYVKAYFKRNKNDAADAEAICEAIGRPTMRFVPVKTADQQAAVLLHRGRERLVRQRTGLVNALRGHLAEFGVIAPRVTRAAVLRDSAIAAGPGFFGAIQSTASSLGIAVRPVDVRDAAEIERSITAFAQGSNAGLVVTGSPAAAAKRDVIIALAARHRLPAVYNNRLYGELGGLICYGTDFLDQFRRAAGYVDRILKGEKPADLPVQTPTKYELVINLKTAKALGLEIPTTVLARADEVIE